MDQSKDDKRKRKARRAYSVLIVSIDYACLTSERSKDHEEHRDTVSAVLGHDRNSGLLGLELVPFKGANKHTADAFRVFIEDLGYPEVVLGSDREASTLNLKTNVKTLRFP